MNAGKIAKAMGGGEERIVVLHYKTIISRI